MTNFSYGPWQVYDGRGDGTSEQVRVDSPYDGGIAVFASSSTGLVNACIAAAAPEMLEALNALALQTSDWTEEEVRKMGMETTLDLMRKALAKATQPVQ